MTSPAREARIAAGFSLAAAAKRLRRNPDWLRRLERIGFPYHLAEAAAQLYEVPITAFLRPPTLGGKNEGRKGSGQRCICPESAGDAASALLAAPAPAVKG